MNIPVRLDKRAYKIHIANSYLDLPGQINKLNLPKDVWVISHNSILRRHGKELLTSLRNSGLNPYTITVPESESSKSWGEVRNVVIRLSKQAAMRIPTLVAFGGGVVGDLTGFIAAVFRRGVPYVQAPTTLLSQVDSAIGGKVAVDMPQGKNLIGSFYQPKLVYNNVSVLKTLPLRQRLSGLAEVIKYGVIASPILCRFLEQQMDRCIKLESKAVRIIVSRSCAIKARVVVEDECDTSGIRAKLNFGHTLGHAIETASGYSKWTHGEAIAIGMCAVSELSRDLGYCSNANALRVIELIKAAGLPTKAKGVSQRLVRQALKFDKKFVKGQQCWVMLRRIGQVTISSKVPNSSVEKMLKKYVG